MGGLELAIFLGATFFGGVVSGMAGFALGLVVSAFWLHIMSPIQAATIIVGYGLVMQTYGTWKLRRALNWRHVWPFILGGTVGVPIGAMLLTRIDPDYVRTGIGILLIAYGSYGLARPSLKPLRAGAAADAGIGLLNGLLSGMTGLPGIIVTIWCQLRGLSKDAQRTIFQPVILATLAMSIVSLGLAGAITRDSIKLFLLGIPVLIAGAWAGLRLYGRLDDDAFRKVILVLLLVSGLTLVVPKSLF